MRGIWQKLQTFLTFSSRDKRALLLFAALLTLSIIVPHVRLWLNPPKPFPIYITHLPAAANSEMPAVDIADSLFPFDPNTATRDDLLHLGLTAAQTNNLLKYREAGGSFRNRDDLLKLNTISKEEYLRLRYFIRIPRDWEPRQFTARTPRTNWPEREVPVVDINFATAEELQELPGIGPVLSQRIVEHRERRGGFTDAQALEQVFGIDSALVDRLAPYIMVSEVPEPVEVERVILPLNLADSAQLTSLKGIGPAFARRIVEYRTRLGGFISADQLLDVYGMDSVRWQSLVSQVNIDPTQVRKLSLNRATEIELAAHPYISRPLAVWIVKHRLGQGQPIGPEALKKSYLVTDELYKKLLPYIGP
jgi:competence ComEA-like helix-hairpin-helix protein